MGRKKVSVLSKKPVLKVPMQFRVDPALKAELKRLHERLGREDSESAFDADQSVEDFLRRAIQDANKELDAVEVKNKERGPGARPGSA